MELDDLTRALTAHDPGPQAVRAALRAKRARRTRRRGLAAGALAASAVLAAVWFRPFSPAPGVPGHPAPPVSAPADGCARTPLAEALAQARRAGASIVLARGALTGRAGGSGPGYAELSLTDVRTLAGPAVPSGALGEVYGAYGPAGAVPGADTGALWAPDGSLFGIVWPQPDGPGGTARPVLRVAPVVGQEVVLSSAGCWTADDLPGRPFTGRLAEIPGSSSYARAAASGFRAVPLDVVERLAAP